MDKSRVLWQEGLFLRPQHFQQQERFLLDWVETRCRVMRPYNWGLSTLQIDTEALALGKLVIIACQGVFPDGTPFDVPYTVPAPPPLDITADIKNGRIYLGLPLYRAGTPDLAPPTQQQMLSRYTSQETQVRDVYTLGMSDPAVLQVGVLQLSLLTDNDNTRAFSLIPLVQIVEKSSDNMVRLEEKFIPTVLQCQTSLRLVGFIREILGMLKQRGDGLATDLANPTANGVAEISQFLQLQVINRYELLFGHLDRMVGLHPEDIYRLLLMLAGELATFTHAEKRPPLLPEYRHDDLERSFFPLIAALRLMFSTGGTRKTLRLEIVKRQFGVWVAMIADKNLLDSASFVLAAKANIAPEAIRQSFPRQTTISTVEKIANLVNTLQPGIELYPMAVLPPQIPFHVGFTYFELNTRHNDWKLLETSGGLAVHVGVKHEGLELELWAIRA